MSHLHVKVNFNSPLIIPTVATPLEYGIQLKVACVMSGNLVVHYFTVVVFLRDLGCTDDDED